MVKHIPKEYLILTDRSKDTILFKASTNSRVTKEIIQTLIDNGSKVNHKDEYGGNFLLNLCYNRELTVDLLKYGLSLGFKITDTNRLNYTPLHVVSQVNGPHFDELFKFLLEQGANINAENIHGETPLYYYCRSNVMNQSVLEQFIGAGAVLHHKEFKELVSKSPLTVEYLKYCIQHGKDVVGPESDALSYIAMRNPQVINDELIQTFLDHGQDIHRPHSLFSPLKHLCNNLKSTPEQIRCLIRHGAHYGKEDNDEHSAYSILKYHKKQEFADSI
ncbi:Hypothetical protein HVR_LOCUS846 [uncultured virus]|nr:Hypothetical protein HVR_LOCUS846 [uncultured virus]